MYRFYFIIMAIGVYQPACTQHLENKGLKPLEYLIGTWLEKTDSTDVTHQYVWTLDNQYIRSQTDSYFTAKKDTISTHFDVGYFSYDKAKKNIIFRQFHSEGFVNTYEYDPDLSTDSLIVFTSIRTENAGGMRARLTIERKGKHGYEMVLHLAGPGDEFAACQWVNAVKMTNK